jgi:hypothetical protein
MSKSKVLSRISGANRPSIQQQQYVSENNVIVVRFYADNTVTKSGFTATWKTGEMGFFLGLVQVQNMLGGQ